MEQGPVAVVISAVRAKLNGKDGLPRAQLNLDGTNKPAWQFDDAESAAKAAQDQKH